MEAKFKVGDNVRVIRILYNKNNLGYEGVVEEVKKGKITNNYFYYVGGRFMHPDELELIDQPHKEEGKATETPSFMVFVEGRSFPNVKHTLADAHKEAKRLCLKEKRKAHIISTFGCYELSVEFKGDF